MDGYGQQGAVGGLGAFAQGFLQARQRKEDMEIQREALKLQKEQQKLKERDLEIDHAAKQKKLDLLDQITQRAFGGHMPQGPDMQQGGGFDWGKITPDQAIAMEMGGLDGAMDVWKQNQQNQKVYFTQVGDQQIARDPFGNVLPEKNIAMTPKIQRQEVTLSDGRKILVEVPEFGTNPQFGKPGQQNQGQGQGPQIGGGPAIPKKSKGPQGYSAPGGLTVDPGVIPTGELGKFIHQQSGENPKPGTTYSEVYDKAGPWKVQAGGTEQAGKGKSALAAMDEFDKLIGKIFTDKNRMSALTRMPSMAMGTMMQTDPDLVMFNDLKGSIMVPIARAFETGVLTDADMNRWNKALPKLWPPDTQEIAKLKASTMRELLNKAMSMESKGTGRPKSSGKSDPARAAARRKLGLE